MNISPACLSCAVFHNPTTDTWDLRIHSLRFMFSLREGSCYLAPPEEEPARGYAVTDIPSNVATAIWNSLTQHPATSKYADYIIDLMRWQRHCGKDGTGTVWSIHQDDDNCGFFSVSSNRNISWTFFTHSDAKEVAAFLQHIDDLTTFSDQIHGTYNISLIDIPVIGAHNLPVGCFNKGIQLNGKAYPLPQTLHATQIVNYLKHRLAKLDKASLVNK